MEKCQSTERYELSSISLSRVKRLTIYHQMDGTEPRSDPSLPKSVQVGELVLRINDDILRGKFVALNGESAEADEEARQHFEGVSRLVKRKWANVHCVVL